MPLAHNGLPSQVAGGQASGTLKLAPALEPDCALQLEDRRRGPQTGTARGSHLHPVEDTGVPFTRGLGWQQGTGPQADSIPSGCWKENPSHSGPSCPDAWQHPSPSLQRMSHSRACPHLLLLLSGSPQAPGSQGQLGWGKAHWEGGW